MILTACGLHRYLTYDETVATYQKTPPQQPNPVGDHAMKPNSALRNFLALAGSSIIAVSSASAATGTWDTNAAGNWTTITNWLGDADYASGADSTAIFGDFITADRVITLNAPITIGNITASDTSNNYTISGANTLTLDRSSGVPIIDVTTSRTLTIGSNTATVIAGNDGLQKSGGAGTLTLSGTAVNTFTGGLNVNSGTLALTFVNLATPTNLIDSANALSFGGGLMTIMGKSTGTTAQTFAGTTVNACGGSLLINPNNGTSTTVTLGALTTTAPGSSLVLGKAITANTGTVAITTTTDKDATGIYGGRIVFANGTASTGSGTYTLGAYSGYTTTLPTNTGSSTTNYSITAGITLDGNLAANTLKIVGSATPLALAGNTLTIKSGGLLSTGSTAQTISGAAGNKLTAGSGSGGAQDLVIHQYNSGGLAISAVIGDNGNVVNLVKAGINTLILNGVNTYTGNTTINAGTLQLGTNATANGASLNSGNYAGNIFIASGALLSVQTNANQVLSGVISGDGNLQKGYSGTLTLSDNNTYTGTTTIQAITNQGGGTLSVSSINSLGTGPGYAPRASSSLGAPTTVANGTITLTGLASSNVILKYTGPGETTDRVLNFVYNATQNRGVEASGTGLIKFVSPVLSSGGTGAGGNIALSGTGLGEIAGVIPKNLTGSTTSGVVKTGTGTWTLSGANAYIGATTVSLGTIIARSDQALGTTSTANVSIAAGVSATGLNYVAATDTALNIGGTLTINGGANTFIGGSIGSTATSARINVAGNALVPTAAVKVNVYGVSGVDRPSGTTQYTLVSGLGGGATTLNNGTYTLGTVFNNTDFTVAPTLTKSTIGLFIDVTKATALNVGTFYVGNLSGATNVWAASNGIDRSNFATSSGATSQVLVPGSAASVTIDNNSNATSTVLGADMSISGLTISDNSSNFALNGDGYSLTIGTGGITKNNTTTKTATIGANIVLGGNQTWSNSDTGNALVVSGTVTGAGTLTKSGAGTLTLSGINAYTGATTVTGGKLIVNGSISTSTLTTVQTGATLGGSGSVGALTIDSGGFLAPGNSPGTTTVNGAYTQNGSLISEITGLTPGTQHDQVIVNGTVTLNGLLDLTTFSGTYAANDLIFILLNDGSDTISGTFTNLADGAVASTHGGFNWIISYFGNQTAPGIGTFTGGNDIVLQATVIPEPATALLGCLGGLLILRRRRS